MKINEKTIVFYCLLVLICTCIGCAHGPARHHTLGYYRYATVEFTKRSSLLFKPVAFPAGLATDLVLVAVDTAITPIAAFIVPGVVVDVGADEETKNLANLVIPTYPLTLADIGAMEMGSGTKEEYEAIFGHESSLFQEVPSDQPPDVQADP